MQTTKIITALIFGVFGFWVFSLVGEGEARHILISDTAARHMPNGLMTITFAIENTGAPDRIDGATSSYGDIQVSLGHDNIVVPSGTSSLSLEAAHLVLAPNGPTLETGTLLPLTLTFNQAGTVTVRARVSDPLQPGGIDGSVMQHGAQALDAGPDAPTLSVLADAHEDGWRITLDTQNFQFSEDAVDQDHVPGMGHGHLYVAGTKIGRVFGPVAYIGALPSGTHEVEVTLNTNNHMAYVANGQTVAAQTVIKVD